MEMIPVNSRNLASVGYDFQTQTLYVRFRQNSLYAYFDVPQYIYNELLRSPSKGQYLNTI